jgi:CHAT domain-containing protein/Tfp pilus assembly protein PilF
MDRARPAAMLLLIAVLASGSLPAADQPAIPRAEADSLHRLGDSLLQAGKYDSAQVILESEVQLREVVLDSLGLANGLNGLAEALWRGGKYREGLETAKQALTVIRNTVGENDTLAARSFSITANLNAELGDFEPALENHRQALSIRLKQLGPEHPDVAASYNNIGTVYEELNQFKNALENYEKSLAIKLKVLGPEHPKVAASYNNIGNIYQNLGDYTQALAYHQKALAIKLKTLGPEHPDVAYSYNSIGLAYRYLGDYKQGLENQKKSLAIVLKALGPKHPDVAKSYINLGVTYWCLGDYEKALENFYHAQTLVRTVFGPDNLALVASYDNLGLIFNDLGDYDKALDNLTKSLAIKRTVLGPENLEVAYSYNHLGNVYNNAGQFEKALENHQRALAILEKVLGSHHRNVAACYNNLGLDYAGLGNYSRALEGHTHALAIMLGLFGPGHPDVAENYHNIGAVYYKLGDFERALDYFNRSLSIQLSIFDPGHPNIAKNYLAMAKVLRAQKKPELALDYLKKSVAITEKVRGGVSSEELKKTYTESVRDRYDEIITLLLELGRPKEAFEYYERSKSKLLQDELKKEGVEIGQGEVRKKLGQVRSLSNQVGALEKQVIDEKSKPAAEQNKTKIENLTRLLAQTKSEFYQLVTEIKQNPTFAFTVDINPVAFASIQKGLPQGTKVVMYYEAKDALYIFLITKDGYLAKSVAVAKDSLDALVQRFRKAIDTTQIPIALNKTVEADEPDLKNTLTTLYQFLIQPIAEELKLATEITIIPSGILYYLPFEVLARNDGTKLKYLVEDVPISYLTSAELFRYVEGKKPKKKGNYDLLLVGNPTGADLSAAEDEVKAISALYPRSRCFLESQATKSVVEAETPTHEILHLATHAVPDTKNPWQSYIYLTRAGEDDGRWTMAEVTNETWDKMELVTLSACETAIGGDKPGLEMESMARAFSIAGAPSIVATLWPVYDPSTRDLMVDFYTNLKTMSKVEALRQAQLSLIHDRRYGHPYFWAPFILIGDWR